MRTGATTAGVTVAFAVSTAVLVIPVVATSVSFAAFATSTASRRAVTLSVVPVASSSVAAALSSARASCAT